ncbi:MAG: hypothetical protein HKN87_17210 [Saprospiraceae bacterium]|nr:hypothetical protein [Saprospiraceae bacterium]
MKSLDKEYIDRLEEIKAALQTSPELEQYLSEEEPEDYNKMQDKFEKQINAVYDEVAAKHPLQLFDLENYLIDPAFEGLFFPRLLGYAVLRGDANDDVKYVRPQEHFKKILLAICNSFYFDIVKQRIGQAVQIGFALSSDIWITNLVEEIPNKNIKQFLISQKLDKYRDLKHRNAGYRRFQKQFQTTNFQSTDFPSSQAEMNTWFGSMRKFLEYRISTDANHESYLQEILTFIENEDLQGTRRYVKILSLVANFIDFGKDESRLSKVFNVQRSSHAEFSELYFQFLQGLVTSKLPYSSNCDLKIFSLLDEKIDDDLYAYYSALSEVSKKGFVHDDAKEAVRLLYSKYDGLSLVNSCLRLSILKQFVHVLRNLTEEEYPDYFEINKTFVSYMDIFDYQQFNQALKEESVLYVRKLLKKYTDKRGKDYQDIKKFVIPTFQDLGFMKEKEVLELFKTRRKKRAKT